MKQLLISFLLVIGLVVPSFACDTGFIQEPTVTAPVQEYDDTVAGLHFRIFEFPDGRKLMTVYVILLVSAEEATYTQSFPLFYIIETKDHKSITYIDREGRGECVDIQRY